MRFRLLLIAALEWIAMSAPAAPAQKLVLSERQLLLRSGPIAEWNAFVTTSPDGRRFELSFDARSNTAPASLFIRQDDVRQDWTVEMNGQRLGKLFTMEADLIHSLAVPPGLVREGSNHLAILPPQMADDIVIRSIVLDGRSLVEATAEAILRIHVRAEQGSEDLPCRITIVNRDGALAALVAATNVLAADKQNGVPPTNTALAVRPGVVYTGNGQAEVGLQAGSYLVYASRGFEWSMATQAVTVAEGGRQNVELSLRREVDTTGWVSCDTHVHTFTFSRHGDCTMEERMLTLAGEGVELPVATDHNLQVDYAEAARLTRMGRYFTPITGNEVTTPAGHFNIFPVRPDARSPDFKITDWPRLMKALRATPDVRVIILNHPRNVHNGFQPFAATNFNAVSGDNLRGPDFTFDAMELMNSSAQQSDYMVVYRDWFALLNHGYRITAVGSSDCHDVSRYIVGQGRTYIAADDSNPSRIDVPSACSNLVAGRAVVSMGLLPQIQVDDRFGAGDLATGLPANIRVAAKVLGPSWASVTNVALFANGVLVREEAVPANNSAGTKGLVRWTLPRPRHDVHLVVIATGPEVTAPFWAIPKPYQPVTRAWTGRVIGSTNPVWIDGDGDGRFSSARVYAADVLKNNGPDLKAIFRGLRPFDEAIAAQAASLCMAAGISFEGPAFTDSLEAATPAVRRGFEAFAATQRQ
ncbi:MAG TPA: CehA/McbA family metallohydrolase [Verrucomicrobiae bacterium]|nr:CehA/McbA family metallohydrolase [Verrucomicrobiae bacterium]